MKQGTLEGHGNQLGIAEGIAMTVIEELVGSPPRVRECYAATRARRGITTRGDPPGGWRAKDARSCSSCTVRGEQETSNHQKTSRRPFREDL